ncbi:MAG: hypothetical protein E4H14_19840 [Candidatus Thorarchaeota archaeon]|nr:MAG: hypothetical protein E4H14_19840 [Candidatus Thorarchaeota archaeon]
MYLYYANETIILLNEFYSNDLGLEINQQSFSDSVTWNAFDSNVVQTAVNRVNTVDYNYWSDYGGTDVNLDGIGDTPHPVPGTSGVNDLHPLVYKPMRPQWVVPPVDKILECGNSFSYDLDVESYAPIDEWGISDESRFSISSELVITSNELLPIGEYTLSVWVGNIYGVYQNSSFIIKIIDTIAPSISSPVDLVLEHLSEGNYISWQISDFSPSHYSLLRNGENLYSNSSFIWSESPKTLVYDLDYWVSAYDVNDVFNITLIVYDMSGHSSSDTVYVTIVEPVTTITTTNTTTSGLLDGVPIIILAASAGGVVLIAFVFILNKRRTQST